MTEEKIIDTKEQIADERLNDEQLDAVAGGGSESGKIKIVEFGKGEVKIFEPPPDWNTTYSGNTMGK